ncbi:hypothetical protein [Caulobacter hibisci]|uniref:Uncharacterized protein n=1 Tax=Caulobacter hibisci TaxID=2035993 RepID=A0ABS0T097_9CAUL|nr:hypothetical protein [Caulobacter hibisci]MBI1685295.1 hypothetical protein [Caulobacter hibisci]
MKRTYMIAAAMVASLTAGPVLADATPGKPKSPPPAAAAAANAPAPELTAQEKAGCGAVLVILGKVATSYPQIFASKGGDGRGMQFVLEAFGAKGRTMMDEAFEDGAEKGVKPSRVYEDGLQFLFENVKPAPGETAEAAGKRAGVALLQRCTGIDPS